MKVLFNFVVFLLTLCFFNFACKSEPAPKATVKIGIIAPLSGGLSRRGQDIANLIKVLEPHLNKNSEKYLYSIALEDGKCGAGNAATTAAMKFIHFDKMRFLITGCSGETLQVGPIAQKSGVLLIAVLSNHKDVRTLGDYVFRTFLDVEYGIKGFVDYLERTLPGKIIILTEENAFTFGMRDLLLKHLGAKVAFAEDFPADTADVNTLLLKAKATEAAGIYFNVMSEGTLVNLVNKAKTLQLNLKMYSYQMPEVPSFREATGSNSDGMEYIGIPEIENASQEFKDIFAEFMRQTPEGASEPFLLRTTFDAIKSIVSGVEALGPDPSKVKEFLKTYEGQGALGSIKYDEYGDIENLNHAIKRITADGRKIVVGTLSVK